jgi:hypothetical protein
MKIGNGSLSDAEWAARLLRSAQRPAPLSSAELKAIGARLRREPRAGATRLVWRAAVVVALMLCGGALTAATSRLLRRTAPTETAPRTAPASLPAPRATAKAEAPPEQEVAPPPPAREPVVARPRRAAAVVPPAPAMEPAPQAEATAPSALHEEAAMLGAALRRLREDNDAAGALALLDEHDRRFGEAAALADEARRTRIEAWLQQGERAQALAALDALSLRPWGRGRALRATRADLRAEAGRCPEALVDFEALLAGDAGASDTIAERALFGRASCRARQGDVAASRADLQRYLERFPNGAFASRARAALAR